MYGRTVSFTLKWVVIFFAYLLPLKGLANRNWVHLNSKELSVDKTTWEEDGQLYNNIIDGRGIVVFRITDAFFPSFYTKLQKAQESGVCLSIDSSIVFFESRRHVRDGIRVSSRENPISCCKKDYIVILEPSQLKISGFFTKKMTIKVGKSALKFSIRKEEMVNAIQLKKNRAANFKKRLQINLDMFTKFKSHPDAFFNIDKAIELVDAVEDTESQMAKIEHYGNLHQLYVQAQGGQGV